MTKPTDAGGDGNSPIRIDDPIVVKLSTAIAGYLDAAKEDDPANFTTQRQAMAMSAVMAYFVGETHEAETMTVESVHSILDAIRYLILAYVETAFPKRVSQELAAQIKALEQHLVDTDPRFASDFRAGRA